MKNSSSFLIVKMLSDHCSFSAVVCVRATEAVLTSQLPRAVAFNLWGQTTLHALENKRFTLKFMTVARLQS